MARRLMQHQIGQLEEMFVQSPTDAATLKQLAQELEHRKTPRAAALLTRVEQALSSLSKPNSAADPASLPYTKRSDPPSLASLWEAPSKVNPAASSTSTSNIPAEAPVAVRDTPGKAQSPQKPIPKIPLADAYKLLKVAPEASWATVESSRRRLVSESNPSKTASLSSDRRDQILEHARSVNAAYDTIWNARQKSGQSVR